MDEIVAEFLVESIESLDRLDRDLLELELELERLREGAPRGGAAPPPAPAGGSPARPAEPATDRSHPRSGVADATVRVDVSLLDRLMTLVGELVLARNHLVELAASRDDAPLLSASQSVDHITAELQEGVMKTRLQPIRTAWGTFPRVVRDL